MRAIISDIHGNLEALSAVLAEIQSYQVDQIVCLGDIVGHGPHPWECVDLLAEHCDLALLGDLDDALIHDVDLCPPRAPRSLRRARSLLHSSSAGDLQRRWSFLLTARPLHQQGDILYVHGSPADAIFGSVYPEDIYNPQKLERCFDYVSRYCFCGHTDLPGVLKEIRQQSDTGARSYEFLTPESLGNRYSLGEEKVILNVGAVGFHPWDGERRACYVLVDGNEVLFRRVEYDGQTTLRKLRHQ